MKTRLAAALALAALAACTSTTAPATGAGFAEPSAVAVFRGVTVKTGENPEDPVYPYRPYLAVANSAANDLAILDATDDTLVQSPAPLHGLVYPVPGRPLLLVSGDLGDSKPDLLAVVTAGDLPWLGSRLEVIRTWASDGAVEGSVSLPGDVLALAALPFDPAGPGTVQLVAALSGERIAVITFRRSTAGDGTGIDVAGAQVVTSGALDFQPLDLAVIPGDRSRVFAASGERLPDGVLGVAEISLAGTPAFVAGLDALAPTRLVAASHLAEADLLRDLSSPVASALDATAFVDATTSLSRLVVDRVYAVLDESGCGLRSPIACGLVALDPVSRALLLDPTPLGTFHAPYRAPIALGVPLAMAVTGPPVEPPSAEEPQYAGTYLRIAANPGWRQSTAAGGVVSTDGAISFVDLARWEVPSQQVVRTSVSVTVSSQRPAGTTGTQWLVLHDPAGATTVAHTNNAGLAAAVTRTPGYTPSDHWVVASEGVLPSLSGLRAEAGNDGSPWLALQQPAAAATGGAVRLWDPTLGVRIGDIVVIDPVGLGTCATFEATVSDVRPPDATRPGGHVRLAHRTVSPPTAASAAWNRCVDEIPAVSTPNGPFYTATFRSGVYLLTRGIGTAAVHVGRPEVGVPFSVAWQDEVALAASCPLPPAALWPASPPTCDAACRDRCMDLQRVRLARRLSYVNEAPAAATGPAVAFTLALEAPTAAVPRDLSLVIDTGDGRVPFRAGPTLGLPVDPRAVVPFDRSPWQGVGGVRFLVPYAGGIVMDTTPTLPGGSVNTIH